MGWWGGGSDKVGGGVFGCWVVWSVKGGWWGGCSDMATDWEIKTEKLSVTAPPCRNQNTCTNTLHNTTGELL